MPATSPCLEHTAPVTALEMGRNGFANELITLKRKLSAGLNIYRKTHQSRKKYLAILQCH